MSALQRYKDEHWCASFVLTMTVELDDLTPAIAAGHMTGHVPLACSACGAVMMLAPARSGRKCVMTPQCEGKHERNVP